MNDMATTIVVAGSLGLLYKIWNDWCQIMERKMRLSSIAQISSSALEIMRILSEESKNRRQFKSRK
jgi:hypothetical protein